MRVVQRTADTHEREGLLWCSGLLKRGGRHGTSRTYRSTTGKQSSRMPTATCSSLRHLVGAIHLAARSASAALISTRWGCQGRRSRSSFACARVRHAPLCVLLCAFRACSRQCATQGAPAQPAVLALRGIARHCAQKQRLSLLAGTTQHHGPALVLPCRWCWLGLLILRGRAAQRCGAGPGELLLVRQAGQLLRNADRTRRRRHCLAHGAQNEEANLGATLGSVTQGLCPACLPEIVVVDGGSTDGTVRVARAAGKHVKVRSWRSSLERRCARPSLHLTIENSAPAIAPDH